MPRFLTKGNARVTQLLGVTFFVKFQDNFGNLFSDTDFSQKIPGQLQQQKLRFCWVTQQEPLNLERYFIFLIRDSVQDQIENLHFSFSS